MKLYLITILLSASLVVNASDFSKDKSKKKTNAIRKGYGILTNEKDEFVEDYIVEIPEPAVIEELPLKRKKIQVTPIKSRD